MPKKEEVVTGSAIPEIPSGRYPREAMTPITTAGNVIAIVCETFVEIFGDYLRHQKTDPNAFFFENAFRAAWESPATEGDRLAKEFFEAFDRDDADFLGMARLHVGDIAMAYAVQAMKAERNSGTAWSYAADASYWLGILLATPFGVKNRVNPAAELAKLRHAENYALAADVEKYWREHVDPALSAQKAAEQIIRANVVPLSHKKIAEIVSRVRKQEVLRKA